MVPVHWALDMQRNEQLVESLVMSKVAVVEYPHVWVSGTPAETEYTCSSHPASTSNQFSVPELLVVFEVHVISMFLPFIPLR